MNFDDPEVRRIMRKKLVKDAADWAWTYIPTLQAEQSTENARHLLVLVQCARRELEEQ